MTLAPDIYHYSDFKKYLKDYYAYQKERNPKTFSFRIFSNRVGAKSPNYLKLVMEGKREISNKMLGPFAKALGFEKKQRDFFQTLVLFNQAKDDEHKNYHFKNLIQFREYQKACPFEAQQYQYLSRWYYVTIREMIDLEEFSDDPKMIADSLIPKISEKQAIEALNLLEKLKLIQKNKHGIWEIIHPQMSTEQEVSESSTYFYHRQMIQKASEAINLDAKERSIMGLTLSISNKDLSEVKNKIFEFMQDLQSWSEKRSKNADRVFQFNTQFFPLTKKRITK